MPDTRPPVAQQPAARLMATRLPAARPPATPLSRRRLLATMVLVPPALAACSVGGAARPDGPDPLVALAAAARRDAALAAAAIGATPALTEQVEPLRAARSEHATALEAAIAGLDPDRPTVAPSSPPPGPAPAPPTLAQLRDAVQASAADAAAAVLELPVDRVGLVASVAACCSTYAAVLE